MSKEFRSFMAEPRRRVWRVGDRNPSRAGSGYLAKDDRGIAATEAEGVGHDDADRVRLSLVGNVIKSAFRIGIVEVDRGGNRLALKRDEAGHRIDGGRTAQGMAGHTLGAADGDAIDRFPEHQ